MSDEWDLYAVVKSCTAAAAAATESMQEEDLDPFTKFSSLSSQNYDNSFSFPDFQENTKYQGLEEIYREFYVQPQGITTSQVFNENLQPSPLQELDSSLTFSALNSQTKSSNKRRKNEQIVKMVHQMKQEELSADSWAWRKYGQKPIKGSPYPRNYYRCSTSKACSARKQVEQSPNDSTIFIVSYTGEHTHPRPTHRSSLSGSSRTHKTPPPPAAAVPQNPSSPASSPASASTYYSIEGEIVKLGELDDEDEDVLIPNTFMTEEIFGGFD